MYRYETHLHTAPVSKCAHATVRENLEFYKSLGYAGVFITNHFIDGNINIDKNEPYEKKINFFFSDYEEAVKIGAELGIQVLCGAELAYKGCDFLVYGLDKDWFLAHPEIMDMKKSEQLALMMEEGALIVHAHPFREARYIDHIRLFPRYVHGVEIFNANRTEFENEMARQYAVNYELLPFAGSDNHKADQQPLLGGMESETPIMDEADFVQKAKAGKLKIFKIQR